MLTCQSIRPEVSLLFPCSLLKMWSFTPVQSGKALIKAFLFSLLITEFYHPDPLILWQLNMDILSNLTFTAFCCAHLSILSVFLSLTQHQTIFFLTLEHLKILQYLVFLLYSPDFSPPMMLCTFMFPINNFQSILYVYIHTHI